MPFNRNEPNNDDGTTFYSDVTTYSDTDLENETIRLNGTLDEQYKELRKVLKKIYLEDWGSDVFLDYDARPEANLRSIRP